MIRSEPRIALLGNMNNNFFNLCRYLRDNQIDATLLMFPFESDHFLPAADSFDESYRDYVKWLGWGNPYEVHKVSARIIEKDLKDYDFIIGCGTAPAYLNKIPRKLDLFMPYGSDLYHYPFHNMLTPRELVSFVISRLRRQRPSASLSPGYKKSLLGYLPFVWRQRRGIKQSRNVAFVTSESHFYAAALRKLGYQRPRLPISVPMVYEPQYRKAELIKRSLESSNYERFHQLRSQFDFLIFAHSRHCWKNEKDPGSFKGNDRLFIGFSEFLKQFPGKAAIATFEYGSDFLESKALCRSLGIQDAVFWFPLMERKEIMLGLSQADLVVGNLCEKSSILYGVVYESMALSKPLMHFLPPDINRNQSLYPMIQAGSAAEVARALRHYSKDPARLAEIGRQANQWFLKHCVTEPLCKIIGLIDQKASDKNQTETTA